MRVFIAGIMQGSRLDEMIDAQDYRHQITAALQTHLPEVSVTDPYALHPESVDYDSGTARKTFSEMTSMAAEADVLIAFLPQASMGTAIEMWTAYQARKPVIAVTPLIHNWVVLTTASAVLPDMESLLAYIADGGLGRLVESFCR